MFEEHSLEIGGDPQPTMPAICEMISLFIFWPLSALLFEDRTEDRREDSSRGELYAVISFEAKAAHHSIVGHGLPAWIMMLASLRPRDADTEQG